MESRWKMTFDGGAAWPARARSSRPPPSGRSKTHERSALSAAPPVSSSDVPRTKCAAAMAPSCAPCTLARRSRFSRHEPRLLVRAEGQAAHRITSVVGEGEQARVRLEVVQQDAPVGEADAHHVERGRLRQHEHRRAPACELVDLGLAAQVPQLHPAVGRAEHDLVEVRGRVGERGRGEAGVHSARDLAGGKRPSHDQALRAHGHERVADGEHVPQRRGVLALARHDEVGPAVHVHRGTAAHDRQARVRTERGAADADGEEGLRAVLDHREGVAVGHQANRAVRHEEGALGSLLGLGRGRHCWDGVLGEATFFVLADRVACCSHHTTRNHGPTVLPGAPAAASGDGAQSQGHARHEPRDGGDASREGAWWRRLSRWVSPRLDGCGRVAARRAPEAVLRGAVALHVAEGRHATARCARSAAHNRRGPTERRRQVVCIGDVEDHAPARPCRQHGRREEARGLPPGLVAW
eukprot:scaffold40600_cov62-Phaeocystis_antarctica.AAC.3